MRKLQGNARVIVVVMVVAMLALMAGAVSAQDSNNGGERNGRGGRDGGRQMIGRELISLVAEQTGLTNVEVLQVMRDGSTIAEIMTENGGDVDALVSTIVANATERLNEAVAEERITQEEADERLIAIEETVTAILNGEFELGDGPRGNGQGQGGDRRGGLRNLIGEIIEITGLDVEELRDQIRDGATPAEIITANGGDVDAVIDTIVANMTARLNERVEAEDMTQERADEILSTIEQRVTDFMNGIRPVRAEEADV